MLVLTATSTENESKPDVFHETLIELGLLAATVIALAAAIWILRRSQATKAASAAAVTADEHEPD